MMSPTDATPTGGPFEAECCATGWCGATWDPVTKAVEDWLQTPFCCEGQPANYNPRVHNPVFLFGTLADCACLLPQALCPLANRCAGLFLCCYPNTDCTKTTLRTEDLLTNGHRLVAGEEFRDTLTFHDEKDISKGQRCCAAAALCLCAPGAVCWKTTCTVTQCGVSMAGANNWRMHRCCDQLYAAFCINIPTGGIYQANYESS